MGKDVEHRNERTCLPVQVGSTISRLRKKVFPQLSAGLDIKQVIHPQGFSRDFGRDRSRLVFCEPIPNNLQWN